MMMTMIKRCGTVVEFNCEGIVMSNEMYSNFRIFLETRFPFVIS